MLPTCSIDLERLIEVARQRGRGALEEILSRGVAGTQAIPGKHGGPAIATASVFVSVPDHPGELARLFADVGEIGVNIEDLHIDHDPGRPVGLVELVVEDTSAEALQGRSRDQGMGHPPVGLAPAGGVETAGATLSSPETNPEIGSVVVAMDGPSGSGKSSTSRGVATRLGLRYLDTGAQFRAVTAVDARPRGRPDRPARDRRARRPTPRSSPAPTRRTRRSPSTDVDVAVEIRSQRGHRPRQRGRLGARGAPARCSSCSARSSATAGSSSRAVTSARWSPPMQR